MLGFSVTFERYFSHDEYEDVCEADERGFVIENVSLREAMQQGLECRDPARSGYCEPNNSPARGVRWLTFPRWNDGTHEYYTKGISETRSLHFPANLTESSRRRICRLFGVTR